MDLTIQAHAAAGALALALGIAALARDPSRTRSRLFGALALSLATWNIGAALRHAHLPGREIFRAISYAGGAAAGPVALHLSLVLARAAKQRRARLAIGYAAGAVGLIASLLLRKQPGWTRLLALGLPLLLTFILAALALRGHVRSEAGRADARSLRLLLALGALAALVGLTDLLPRGDSGMPALGPLALVPFLFALATLGLERRYFELDTVVARIVAIALTSVAAAGFLQATVDLLGSSALTYFLASLVIVAAAGPLVSSILSGTKALLGDESGGVARALAEASAMMSRAQDAPAAWSALESLAERLPGGASLSLRLGPEARTAGDALGAVLLQDRAPVTRRLLEIDAREAPSSARRELAARARQELGALGLEIAAPLLRGARLEGIVGLGGGQPEAYLRGEAGAALVALGHQALATLDRIEAQEELRRKEALAVVGEMAASLAHDVRNPLGAIRGAAQVLAEARDPAQEKEMLEVIDSETERLGRVLGDFLEWSKPRPSRREPVDAGALARRVVAQARLAAPGAGIELVIEPGARALGDEELLERALANLVRNAREAAGAEGRVRVLARSRGAGEIELRVEDDGPGLDPRVRERLFEPFVTTKPQGTGLGLPLVHRAAHELGGRVECEDLRPRGTAFALVLPAERGVG